jgi:YHS domain-containing protein
MVKKSAIALFLLLAMTSAFAGEKVLVNKDKSDFAVEGHDVVAFFTDHKAVKGDPKIQSDYKGARYAFASVDHKKLFDAEPAKYVPQYGGFCAYGMSRGYTAPVKIETWQIINGRLYLNYDLSVKEKFDKNQAEYLRKADINWPQVLEKEGK